MLLGFHSFRILTLMIVAPLLLASCERKEKPSPPSAETREHRTVYHCAMHPQIIKDGPGNCPICGMALVPIETDSGGPNDQWKEGYPVVHVSESTARDIDIRTAIVDRMPSKGDTSGADSVSPLAIPAQSLIRTGGRRLVVVSLGNGRYQPRDVAIGRETREWIEVSGGLEEGDTIVLSGQFLLQSESEIQASANDLNETAEKTGARHE